MSQVNYAQKGRYFLFLSEVESGDIFINPVEHVSLSNLEIIELFLLSILKRSLKEAFVI